jgi:hypothetical protein
VVEHTQRGVETARVVVALDLALLLEGDHRPGSRGAGVVRWVHARDLAVVELGLQLVQLDRVVLDVGDACLGEGLGDQAAERGVGGAGAEVTLVEAGDELLVDHRLDRREAVEDVELTSVALRQQGIVNLMPAQTEGILGPLSQVTERLHMNSHWSG